ALFRLPLLVSIDLGAADKPIGHPCSRALFSAEETSDIVAKTSVPLLPTVANKAPDLIKTSSVPGFRNEFRASQHRVGFDIPQHRWVGQDLTRRTARQDGGEIETEAVHVHFLNPISEAVHDESANDWVVGVEGISSTAE